MEGVQEEVGLPSKGDDEMGVQVGLPSRGDDEMPWMIKLYRLPQKQHCHRKI